MRQALNHSYRFPQRAESVRTLCIRLPKVVLFLFLLLGAGSLAAQNTDQQIAAQKRLIKLDGKMYTVVDATDEGGVYTITLEANRSR